MKIEVKLDRVTVTGKSHDRISLLEFARQQNWTIKSSHDRVYAVLERFFDNGDSEVIAILAPNPYQQDSWRVDTSNHLNSYELKRVSSITQKLIGGHLTRIDIAFDFINGFYEPMKHVIVRSRATLTKVYEIEYRDCFGCLQTLYSGRRSSDKMYRLYNKLVEQEKHKVAVSNEIKRWERWEIQLRGKKTSEWVDSAKEMLSQVRYPTYENLKPNDKAVLHAIDDGLVNFKDFSKEKAARLRKLRSRGFGYNDDYARLAEQKLVESIDRINDEVSQFLDRL